jgi:hypothetical protein
MTLRYVTLLIVASGLAQESQPTLNPLEKAFEQSMSGVTLAGHFTRQGGTGLSDDKYNIDKVTKVKDDLWRFDTRIQYGGNDVKMPVSLHVKWAGDTPVLFLTDEAIAGMGKFTVRIVIYDGHYAGTWSGGKGHGGQMFGDIVKTGQ